jgi:hypothetical protein
MFSPGRDFLAVVFAMCAFVVLEVVVSKPLRNRKILLQRSRLLPAAVNDPDQFNSLR